MKIKKEKSHLVNANICFQLNLYSEIIFDFEIILIV